jgi:tRNA nucleotidyltransferase (CCA-adding enzyme)
VSAERVHDEWVKTMKAKKPSRAFEVMRTSGILGVTCPELLEGVDMEQNKWHAFTVWGHAMACVDACAGDAVLRISALLHDIGKPRSRAFSDKTQDYTFYDHERIGAEIVEPVLARMRFSNDDKQRIVRLVRHHLICYDDWSDTAVRRWMRRVGPDLLEDLYTLNEADVRGKGRDCSRDLETLALLKAHVEKVVAAGAALSTRDLAVNGRDLMQELALAPGPILGELLDALLEEVVGDPTLNEREPLLARARAYLDARPPIPPKA